jgi:tetratricopeptide (TPR) repeat protein
MQKMEDLEEATRLARKAIDVTPDDHPDFAAMLNNLANKLRSRFERTNEMKDLEEAIRKSRHAVQVTPDGHKDLAHRLSNLGRSLQMRYERTGDIENYEEAIRVSQQAVQLTPDDHSHLAAFLNELGNTLLLSASSAKDNILKVFLRAWNCYNATPFTRIRSSTRMIATSRNGTLR